MASVKRARLLQPLRHRDFALLVSGSTVSLLGDGFFFVALAWQVYEISNVPTALSIVWVAWTLPSVIFLLIGGAFSDRYDRRLLMVWADIIRAVAIGLIGVLSIAGILEIWHIAVLIVFVGIGDAFFNPASTVIVPDIVPEEDLLQANALRATLMPLMVRMIGPALAGFVVAAVGSGWAFVIDGGTFLVSAVAVFAIRPRPMHSEDGHGIGETIRQVREGLTFVFRYPWLWATLVGALLSLLVFFGPVQTLLPFLVKNRLNLGPEALGLIFAVGGVGAIVTGLAIGQLGLPRKRVTVMYPAWSVGIALLAVYGLMTELWQALLISFITQALFQVGQVTWTTLLQTLVPRRLLGRVTSVDWMVSTGLVPVSFALTGPIAEAFGAGETMVAAAIFGGVIFAALLYVPGVRDPEKEEWVRVTEEAARATGLTPDSRPT
jgi:DHA3 family tetracycline resistance protein-like MFS transporter